MPDVWTRKLHDGWHGINANEWMEIWLPEHMTSEMERLNAFEDRFEKFSTAVRREKRDLLARLIRSQHLLPWFSKKKPLMPFFREVSVAGKTAFDHPIPVRQLVSLVEMALFADDEKAATDRLKFAWLCPPALLCNEEGSTHSQITAGANALCHDFDLPLSRYGDLEIIRFDDQLIYPKTYTRSDLVDDLIRLNLFGEIPDRLKTLELPHATAVNKWGEENV